MATVAVKQEGWWTVTPTGRYRLTKAGSEGLARLGITQRAGTFVAERKLIAARDGFIASRKKVSTALAQSLKAGDISLDAWVLKMRQEIKSTHIANYILGRGGIENMTPSDWGRIGQRLQQQYGFLNDFAGRIADNENWSPERIAARAQMYFEASGADFEQGRTTMRGLPKLPEYPGDGQQDCLTNCKCYWRIVEKEREWRCYWTLQPAEHCDSCLENEAKWNPLIVLKATIPNVEAVKRHLQAVAA